jgi:hypothetical protein
MQGAGTPPCHRTSPATIEQSLALQLLLSSYGGAVAAAGRETVYAPPPATESDLGFAGHVQCANESVS